MFPIPSKIPKPNILPKRLLTPMYVLPPPLRLGKAANHNRVLSKHTRTVKMVLTVTHLSVNPFIPSYS